MNAAHTPSPYAVRFGILTGDGDRVAMAYFQDVEGNDTPNAVPDAARVLACLNALHGLTNEQVERLGRFLAAHNRDEVEVMLTESGYGAESADGASAVTHRFTDVENG